MVEGARVERHRVVMYIHRSSCRCACLVAVGVLGFVKHGGYGLMQLRALCEEKHAIAGLLHQLVTEAKTHASTNQLGLCGCALSFSTVD